jgi:hypothetical protein
VPGEKKLLMKGIAEDILSMVAKRIIYVVRDFPGDQIR